MYMYRLVFCFHDFHLGLWWAHLETPRSLIIFSVATSQAPKDKLRFIFGLADQDDSHLAGWIWMAFSNTCRFLDGQVLWSGEPTCPIWSVENTEPLYPGDTWVQSLPSAEATLWMNFNSWISSPPSCGALGQPLASSTRRPGRGLRAALDWNGVDYVGVSHFYWKVWGVEVETPVFSTQLNPCWSLPVWPVEMGLSHILRQIQIVVGLYPQLKVSSPQKWPSLMVYIYIHIHVHANISY